MIIILASILFISLGLFIIHDLIHLNKNDNDSENKDESGTLVDNEGINNANADSFNNDSK